MVEVANYQNSCRASLDLELINGDINRSGQQTVTLDNEFLPNIIPIPAVALY